MSKINSKTEFTDYLVEKNINSKAIEKFKQLPETIEGKKIEYKFNCNIKLNNRNEFEYEMNYYSQKNLKFLFPYKIKNDLEECINEIFNTVISFVNKSL